MKKSLKFVLSAGLLATVGAMVLTACNDNKRKYVVSFETNGGSDVEPLEFEWGQNFDDVTMPETTKKGYTFINWYVDSNFSALYSTVESIEDNMTLYAKWDINQYTISFNTNGGSEIAPITADYDSTVDMPTNPTKDGYTFSGWYVDQSLETPFSFDETSNKAKMPATLEVGGSTMLYAKWVANTLIVNFNSNIPNDTQKMDSITFVTGQSNLLSQNTFRNPGHTFLGWALTPDGEIKYTDREALEIIDQNGEITLYAVWGVNSHTVSYSVDGLSRACDPVEVNYGGTIGLTPTAEKIGYEFLGWGKAVLTADTTFKVEKDYFVKTQNGYLVTSVTVGEAVSDNTYYEIVALEDTDLVMPDNDVTLYARFAKNQYTIRFVDSLTGEEFTDITSITKYFGESITLPVVPDKAGYTKKQYWYENQELTTPYTKNTFVVGGEDKTLYASYTINSYSFKLVKNNGQADEVYEKEYGATLDDVPSDPVKVGYTFTGWYEDSACTISFTFPDTMPILDTQKTIYAGYAIKNNTITFDSKGGSEVENITADYGATVEEPVAPKKVGYTFAGWFESEDYSGESYTFQTMPADSITLYAKWDINQYKIVFESNGGSSVEGISADYDADISSLKPADPTKEGYSFGGWFLDAELERAFSWTNAKMPAASVKGGSTTLYAKWTVNQYVISFASNGGSDVTAIKQDYGTTVTKPADPTKDGYTFAGWYKDAEFASAYTFTTMPSSDITVYAKWVANTITISFNGNGGTGNMSNQVVSTDDIAQGKAKLNGNSFVKEGHTFLGWATAKDSSEIAYANLKEFVLADFAEKETKISLFAIWDVNEYTISFESNGGSTVTAITQDFGTAVSQPDDPTRVGYTFVGWYKTADFSDSKYTFSTMSAENITLYAKWSKNSYKVTFNSNGGTNVPQASVDYQDGVVAPTNPTKVGYTFGGWYTDAACSEGKEVDFTNFKMPAEDVTFYAKWNAANVNVTVKYFGTKIASTDYESIADDEIINTYKTGETTAVSSKEITGFTFASVEQKTVLADGSTVVSVYYTRNSYTVSFVEEGHDTLTKQVEFGDKIGTLPEGLLINGYSAEYEIDGQPVDNINNTVITGNTTVNVIHTANDSLLTFDAQGGHFEDGADAKQVEYATDEAVSNPGTVTRDGYTFGGWYTDAACSEGNEVDFASYVMPASATTLYAKWTIKSLTISFESNGGSTIESITQNYDTAVSLSNPTRDGYTFEGWYYDEALTNKVNPEGFKMPSSNITLYAKWTAHTITIVFDGNGGDGEMANQVITTDNFASGEAEINANEFTREGYTFEGWATSADGDVAYVDQYDAFQATDFASSSTLNLYAVWTPNQYTITFVVGEGATPVTAIEQAYESTVAAPTAPTKTGYTFGGWFTSEDCSGSEYIFSTMPLNGQTLYAKWTINQYTISFVVDGGSEVASITQDYASNVAAPTDPTKTGYTFGGWFTSEDCSGSEYIFSTMPLNGQTLYAKWTVNTYKVTFVSNGGSEVSDQNVDYGTKVTAPTAPTKTGYDFGGWYSDSSFTSAFDFANTNMGAADITLYAKWTVRTINIIFHGNGNTDGTMTNGSVNTETVDAAIADNAYGKTGYTFAGWATSADGDVVYSDGYEFVLTDFATGFTSGSKTLDLYAIWTVNQYSITFVTNGGSSVSTITQDYASEVSAPTAPTKDGYTFGGWYLESEVGGYNTDGSADGDWGSKYIFTEIGASDVTLYARWLINTYNIYFDTNGGSAIDSTPVVYKGAISSDQEPADPTRDGYTFAGWFTKDGEENGGDWGEEFSFSGTMPASDLTAYAKWTVNQYTITFETNGGSTVESITQDYNSFIEAPADPTKASETFMGWFTKDGTGDDWGDLYSFSNMPAENITLYARWDSNVYTLIYRVGDQEVYRTTSNSEHPDFTGYVYKIQNEIVAYQYVYKALEQAASGGLLPAGPEKTELEKAFTSVVVYSMLIGQSYDNQMIFAITGGNADLNVFAYGIVVDMNNIPLNSYGSYYAQILTAAQALQAAQANPSQENLLAEQEAVTALGMTATTNPTVEVYTKIANAAQTAATGGDASTFTAYATYATLAYNASLLQPTCGSGALAAVIISNVISDETVAVTTAATLTNNLPYSEYADYYNFIATYGQTNQEAVSNETSNRINSLTSILTGYTDHAYNPYFVDESKAFDGWSVSVNEATHEKTYVAQFVEPISSVGTISTTNIKNASVTFTWDVVTGAYGYKVEVYLNGSETPTITNTVKDNQYLVSGLKSGDTVIVKVYTLMANENGEIRETSNAYTATRIVDPYDTITSKTISLTSEASTFGYSHIIDNDIGKVSKYGDFYYYYEDYQETGHDMYFFFASTSYTFGDKNITLRNNSCGAYVDDKVVEGDSRKALFTTAQTGTFEFSVDGGTEWHYAEVLPLINSIDLGESYEQYTKVKTTKLESTAKYGFLADNTNSKESFKIGTLQTNSNYVFTDYSYDDGVGTKYYNGVKFDFLPMAMSAKSIPSHQFLADYSFKKNGTPITDQSALDNLFFYDAENDVFFFKPGNTGTYEVTVTPRADKTVNDEQVVNPFVPMAYKNSGKVNSIKQTFTFELNDGINVYTNEALQKAYADLGTTAINIQCDIETKFNTRQVGFTPFLCDQTYYNFKGRLLSDKYGEVDIKIDSSTGRAMATFTTLDGYGPKIWTRTNPGAGAYSYTATDGFTYYYVKTGGEYALKDAEWQANRENGLFKILNATCSWDYNTLRTIDYELGSPYHRTQLNVNSVCTQPEDIVVNGNYFTINAKNIPYTMSTNYVSVGGIAAKYQIQSINIAIFDLYGDSTATFNNLNVLGNTKNLSAMYSESSEQDVTDIAEFMAQTSGGLNGFRSEKTPNSAGHSKIVLNSVSISDTLIALYGDDEMDAHYTYIQNSWANGLYSWNGNATTLNIDHSIIKDSGGAALDVEDQVLGANPTLNIDFATTFIENDVSGEEQWFKGYQMEVISLALKSNIEKVANGLPGGGTILKDVVNPFTGVSTQKMNWIFFGQSNNIDNPLAHDAADQNVEFAFGSNVTYIVTDPNSGYHFLLSDYLSGNFTAPVTDINDGTQVIDVMPFEVAGMNFKVYRYGTLSGNVFTPDTSRMYLSFHSYQDLIGCYIYGMCQLWPNA